MIMSQMHCSGCGGTKFQRLEPIEAIHYSPGREFLLFHCETCGLVHTDMAEERASVQAYYPDNYKPHVLSDTKRNFFRSLLMRKLRKFTFGKQETASSEFIQQVRSAVAWLHRKTAYRSIPVYRTDGKLLDVGCGIGDYISLLQELGWCVQGIEPAKKAVDFANQTGRNVECTTFEQADYPEHFFDVITMWHVLEHFPNPYEVLLKVSDMMKDNGLLMIGIPNYDSFDRRLFRKFWNGFEIPLHLSHFTPDTIKNVLVSAGFQDIRVIHTVRPGDMFRSFENFLNSVNMSVNIYLRIVLYFISLPLSILFSVLHKSSIIVVYAEKK